MNKRSRDWQKWLAASGKQHPLEFLIEVMTSTPADLREKYGAVMRKDGDAEYIGLEAKDVLALQIRAATEALPYLEQKLPTAVEIDDKSATRTVLVIGQANAAQAKGMAQRFGFRLKENQGVIDVEVGKSDGDKSDDEANALKDITNAE
ncbi:MAG: hypothetical protein ACRCS9_13900 [Hyphomicrobium sp.]